MLVWHLWWDSRHSLQEAAGPHIHSPDKTPEKGRGDRKREMPTKTPQKPGAESSHETVSYGPLHQHTAQRDLYTHVLPQLRLGMGKSHSPNITDASCIKDSPFKVFTSVSSTSLVQENRRKKLCMKTALSVISARKTKDHYRHQMGVISFSRNIAM